MQIETDTIISISEANQNFSKVARLVDKFGTAIIMKNNVPRYVVMEFNRVENIIASDDVINSSSDKFMKRNEKIYEELAK